MSTSASTDFLYRHLPWNFITRYHEGVVVHKDGVLQRTFAYRAPDLDSSSPEEANTIAVRVNDFVRRLGSGWALHIEAQRFYTQDYPTANFAYRAGRYDTLAPYLIDRERAAAFRAAGKHFESSYYFTLTWRPPAAAVQKLVNLFVQSATGGEGAGIAENVDNFVKTTDAVASVLAANIRIAPLNNEETAAYLHSTISLERHALRFPATSILLDRVLPDQELETTLTMRLGGYYIPIIGVNDFPEATYPAILDALNRARLEYR